MIKDYTKWNIKWPDDIKRITEFSDYNGEKEIVLWCTQLNESIYPKKSQRDKILNEWIAFLENNPTAIERLNCIGRMNQKLFDAVCCQENLKELHIKWGVYPDISKITNLQRLKVLNLCSGASLNNLEPVGLLVDLEVLRLALGGEQDCDSLGGLKKLKQLSLDSSSIDGIVKVKSLGFLRQLPQLKNFRTIAFRLLDHDYSPILDLKELEYLSVNMPTVDHDQWNEQLAKTFWDIPYNAHKRFLITE